MCFIQLGTWCLGPDSHPKKLLLPLEVAILSHQGLGAATDGIGILLKEIPI